MKIKLLLLTTLSSCLALAETGMYSARNCSKETVALAMRDLVNLQTAAQAGSPAQKNFDWLDGELKKMAPNAETAYANVRDKVEADAKERAEKASLELTVQYKQLKKEIAETKVEPSLMTSVNRFTNAYNNASTQIYTNGPRDEKTEEAILRNSIGFNAHRLYTQKVTTMTSDLVKDIEAKCLPANLPRGITIGDTKYRALYCIDPNPSLLADVNAANGKQGADECRTYHTCGVRTLEENPNPNFREITMSYACNKKNGVCPDALVCLQEAAKNEQQPQQVIPKGSTKTIVEGSQR